MDHSEEPSIGNKTAEMLVGDILLLDDDDDQNDTPMIRLRDPNSDMASLNANNKPEDT